MHVVQLANFYGPRSGGLRTALHHLGAGYRSHGHAVTLVVPGPSTGVDVTAGGVRRVTVAAPLVPGTGGYRVMPSRRVIPVLAGLRPDVVEVSDRLTLRGLGRWAAARGVRSVLVSHERSDRLLEQWGLPVATARWVADRLNARLSAEFDAVVCTTAFAQAEFARIGAPTARVPLGVDLDVFTPRRADLRWRATLAAGADIVIVHCGRLSPEKHPERTVEVAALLHAAGVPVRLVVAGDGPSRRRLERRARGLPVTFLGFVDHRVDVARLLAAADVALAPGPHETFGLAALEALACGTPVVVSRSSALADLVEPTCGAAVPDEAGAFAAAAVRLADGDRGQRRRFARARAEAFGWPAAIAGMAAVLGAERYGDGRPPIAP